MGPLVATVRPAATPIRIRMGNPEPGNSSRLRTTGTVVDSTEIWNRVGQACAVLCINGS
jgi:hypothetical protein